MQMTLCSREKGTFIYITIAFLYHTNAPMNRQYTLTSWTEASIE